MLVALFSSDHNAKRESGGNPEQTRCCKSIYSSAQISQPLDKGSGKDVQERTSQKTCQ